MPPAGKSLGRRRGASGPSQQESRAAAKPRAAGADKTVGPSKAAGTARTPAGPPVALAEPDRALVRALAARTGLKTQEILSRALAAYAAAVAPGLGARPARGKAAAPEAERPAGRLFVSVEGKPEVEVRGPEFTLGSAEGCDLRLDLPLVSPRHARLLQKEGHWVYEDLRTARGSFLHGEQVDVRLLQDGDEIDVAGFLPLRFRLV